MNLKQLEYFVHVSELGSFSKASLVLNVAQPALSRQVRLLETDLHCTLLRRTGRGVVVTEPGKRLFDRSVELLQLAQRVRDDLAAARDEPTGRITVALPPSIGLLLTLPLVEGFHEILPKARLAVVEGLSTHIVEWVATGRADIGLVLNPEPQAAIEAQPIVDEPLCLISPANRSPSRGARAGASRTDAAVAFAELSQYPLVIGDRTHAIRRLIEAHAALSEVKLRIAWEICSVRSILELVRRGHGHAVMTPGAVLGSGIPYAFRMRPLIEPALASKLCLVTSARKPGTPLVRRVRQMLSGLLLSLLTSDGHCATGSSQLGHRLNSGVAGAQTAELAGR